MLCWELIIILHNIYMTENINNDNNAAHWREPQTHEAWHIQHNDIIPLVQRVENIRISLRLAEGIH